MSADIIPFVPRPRSRKPDETPILFRSRPQADDLVMDHADTAPCEYWPIRAEGGESARSATSATSSWIP